MIDVQEDPHAANSDPRAREHDHFPLPLSGYALRNFVDGVRGRMQW